MKEGQIHNQLATIRGRVERGKGLREITHGREETPQEKLLQDIFEPTTRIARSERLIDPEELTLLKVKVEDVREFLFENGQDFTKHPVFDELNTVLITPEEDEQYRNNFWYKIGDFQRDVQEYPAIGDEGVASDAITKYTAPIEASADRTLPDSENPVTGARVRMSVIDGKQFVYFKIGFDDTYTLQINFFDTENWDRKKAHYAHPSETEYKADLPLTHMTHEEAAIIHHYLDLLSHPTTLK